MTVGKDGLGGYSREVQGDLEHLKTIVSARL